MERPVQITRLPKSEYYASAIEIYKRQHRVPQQIPLGKLSKRASERLITDESVATPDCVTCGACCLYGLIAVNRREPEPLAEFFEITADDTDVVVERALYREEADGRCRHLTGAIAHNVGCNVYENRPNVCRDFEAGSDRCFGFRRMFGIDPPLGESELAAALLKLEEHPRPVKIIAVDIKPQSRSFIFDRDRPDVPPVEELTLKVVAHMSDGEIEEIHSYDPAKESWYEHELEGLTLDAAVERIEKVKVV